MKKLKLQVQISVDGYIAGPNGEMDWITWTTDPDFIDYVLALHDTIDTMVLGRKLAEGFIPYWTDITTRPDDPEYSFANIMVDTSKTVFSKTLTKSEWANTVIAENDLVTEVNNMKKQGGKDIIAYGGAEFVSSLIKNRLIDEYHFFVSPVIIGKGMPIFNTIDGKQQLALVKSTPLKCGIVVQCYKPV
jgi:dihydrofolate reductase